ncbi:5-dehydro-4-deoxyglucarate dehydratase [Nonomuraea sp. NEAU-A123]|uniref:5-dehydro-4-deoxyglucarate dehydratase n=1 Tax=Nonomuraea sp. NEAU-A123 TaxID=2839649 RepID=UPI001BE49017|nr:5-dehydro-4-deoxyglucarate dehydratase [Nonomuraea sp. NEAU-A123]MBT2232451.1 5-dehydro-4-deoxyglucarate dehydratase [Nonomuraea sp. NEAU-A123]
MTATYTVDDVRARLRRGMESAVLSFPLTPFDTGGAVDLDSFRAYIRDQVAAGPGALFPCCGTGEFFSLAEDEYESLVTAAVEETAGSVPVVVGAGYGWAQAARFAAIAERAGADALLLMPPYLVEAPQEGLVEHVRRVAASTSLPVIVYQRAQVKVAVRSIAGLAQIPNVIGFKDGHSDLDQLQRLKLAAPPEWLFFNGAATAEMQARAYRSIGVPAYSSAVHAFAPEIAKAFFLAFHADDHARVDLLLSRFYIPLVELRDKGIGYSVSLVKAGARLRGIPVGPVRAPLADPSPEHLDELRALLDTGLALVR